MQGNDWFVCDNYRMREKVGLKVVKAMKRKDNGVTHAAIDVLCALMQVSCKLMKIAKE